MSLRKARLGPNHPHTLAAMYSVAECLVKLDRGAEAVPVIDECFERAAGNAADPRIVPGLIDMRLRHFERAKDGAGCRTTAEMWERLAPSDAASQYAAACLRAVTAAVLRASAQPETTPADADAEAERAMVWLRQAVASGYDDVQHLQQDRDLDALRQRPDFQQLLSDLETGK